MNFITPLLFVFYLQVMPPPPPPTMHGGGDYWAGNTNQNSDGDTVDQDWGYFDLLLQLILPQFDFGVGYTDIGSLLNAIENGFVTNLSQGEWSLVINFAAGIGDEERACDLARESGTNGTNAANNNNNCPDEVPLPNELLFICIVSFLIILYYHNRKELLNHLLSK
jgi:hypothetical protein